MYAECFPYPFLPWPCFQLGGRFQKRLGESECGTRSAARFGRREESININFGLVFPPSLPLLSLFSDSVSLIPMPAVAAASLARTDSNF